MTIDAHQHFWHYNAPEYGWIDDEMAAIRRDFLPADLEKEIRPAGIDGVVAVQARQTLAETHWLLGLAEAHSFICGVVGWVPLVEPHVGDLLAKLLGRPKFRAVRHVIHDEPDEHFMRRDDFNRGVARLAPLGLAYDILIFERHLPATLEFVDRHPNQIFILDHLGKPRIRENLLEPWAGNLRELARRPHVYCKISGMVTLADYANWTEAQLLPYFETALHAFGPARLMFGSDWPPCLVAGGYARWHTLVRRWTISLSHAEQGRLFGGTAREAYRLTTNQR